jgi:hypothetical protein
MLFGTTVASVLSLKHLVSKHRLRTGLGLTAKQFERRYREALSVDAAARNLSRVLLLDDASTEGSTLRSAGPSGGEFRLHCRGGDRRPNDSQVGSPALLILAPPCAPDTPSHAPALPVRSLSASARLLGISPARSETA